MSLRMWKYWNINSKYEDSDSVIKARVHEKDHTLRFMIWICIEWHRQGEECVEFDLKHKKN